MNGTVSLLRKSLVFLVGNPVVLVPVLATRIADFLTYLLFGLLKGPAMKAAAPRSVLGGFSGAVNGPLVLVAALFTLLPLIVEVVLLVYGMVVSARWAHAIREGEQVGVRSWNVPAGHTMRVAALTLGVGAITTVVGLYLSLRGGVPAHWSYLVTWCFLIMSSWFVLPSWLRLLADAEGVRVRDWPRLSPFLAVVLGLAGFATCLFLGGYVQHRLEVSHSIHGGAAPFAINLFAACLSVIPLGFSFVAMSRHVADRPGWSAE